MAKFNHQPFEEWLLYSETLSPEDAKSLKEHLSLCADCQMLADALQAVESELRHTIALEPAPGFASRWLARLEVDRIKYNRRQTLGIMLFCIGGAMAFVMLLALQLTPLVGSSGPILLALAYEFISTFALVAVFGQAFFTLTRTLFQLLPPTQWAAIFLAMACLGMVWVVSLQRLTSTRRVVL